MVNKKDLKYDHDKTVTPHFESYLRISLASVKTKMTIVDSWVNIWFRFPTGAHNLSSADFFSTFPRRGEGPTVWRSSWLEKKKKWNKSKHASIKYMGKWVLLACQLLLCTSFLCKDAPLRDVSPYPGSHICSKENVKLTKLKRDSKRFLFGQKRISRLVLLFLTNIWKAIDSLLFTNEFSQCLTRGVYLTVVS